MTSTHRGQPTILFSQSNLATLLIPYRFILVDKFSHARLFMENLYKFFQYLNLKEDDSVGLLDARQVIICLTNKANFLQL